MEEEGHRGVGSPKAEDMKTSVFVYRCFSLEAWAVRGPG